MVREAIAGASLVATRFCVVLPATACMFVSTGTRQGLGAVPPQASFLHAEGLPRSALFCWGTRLGGSANVAFTISIWCLPMPATAVCFLEAVVIAQRCMRGVCMQVGVLSLKAEPCRRSLVCGNKPPVRGGRHCATWCNRQAFNQI
jgi:hypothetical protein